MAAYAYTPTIHQKTSKLLGGWPGMKVVSGQINVTNFNGTTPVAIAEITSKFKSVLSVVLTSVGVAANPNIPSWDATNNTIRFTISSTGVALADNTNPGIVNFIAIGY